MREKIMRELVLEGLDCANCAAKIEKKVSEIPSVENANMNFVTKTLRIETFEKEKVAQIVNEIRGIVKKLEPDVVVNEKNRESHVHDEEKGVKEDIIKITAGAVLFCGAVVLNLPRSFEMALYIISYLLVGGEVLLRAGKNILHGQVFDENFLMGIATIGAFAIGQFPEGVAVMLFYQVGELFQDIAVNRSRRSITALMDIRPDYANLMVGTEVKRVTPEEVKPGDIIIVKPGERVPLDGEVIDGNSMMDTSVLTGESVPREVEIGSTVLSGFINKNGLISIRVSKAFGESTVSKILDLVQNASSRKAVTENFITKFARYYTPIVVFSAMAIAFIPPLILQGEVLGEWVYRGLIFLVISCPCALVISIPLGFFGGIGGASRHGVLVKGSNFLEALNNVDTVVFDKTGTLTKGVFNVTDIAPYGSIGKEELLKYAAYAEHYSNHPIAASISRAFNQEVIPENIGGYEELAGYGVKAVIFGREILAGNQKFMAQRGITFNPVNSHGTIVHIAVDNSYSGYIVISDELKKDSARTIESLKKLGVVKTVMLTGDNRNVAEGIGKSLGIDEVYFELLPHEKVESFERLTEKKRPKSNLVFVGDGINDAPVLARADIGVAMGGLGSDAAIEAADVVIMTDEPSKLVSALKIAKRTRRIVMQNIIFALGVKLFVLLLGAGGMATMWEAVFADVGVALIAVLNSMRVMRIKDIS